VQRIVEIAPLDWKGVILVGYYTGARLQDACNLRWANVELDNRLIRFVQRKTGKAIAVAIHPELEEHLFSLTMTDDSKAFLFPSLAQRRGPGRAGLSWTFSRLMKKAGVVAGLARTRGGQSGRTLSLRSFHSLRHTFNSCLANAGVSQEIRRELVGHASDQINRRYTHMELATFQQAISSIPRLKAAL
jgi:integrase